MIKPIGALSLALTGFLLVFVLLSQPQKSITIWIKIFCPGAFALLVWVCRNVLLSGYPLYPVPALSLPLGWTMTHAAVKSNYDAVLGWARMPGPDYLESLNKDFLFWFKPWLIRNLPSTRFQTLAILPLSLSVFFWFLVIRIAKSKKSLFFLGWSALNILYWFFTAPDIRFGGGFFWTALALSLLFLFPSESPFQFSTFWNNRILRWTFRYVWILAICAVLGRGALSSKRSFLAMGSAQSFPVREYTVPSKEPFSIWVPLEGDRTGNSPLPSAPWPIDNIEMREHGNLRKGFRPAYADVR